MLKRHQHMRTVLCSERRICAMRTYQCPVIPGFWTPCAHKPWITGHVNMGNTCKHCVQYMCAVGLCNVYGTCLQYMCTVQTLYVCSVCTVCVLHEFATPVPCAQNTP